MKPACGRCQTVLQDVKDGALNPFKFDNQPDWACHFWHYWGTPFHDCMYCGDHACVFEIHDEDARIFPELADHVGQYAHLYQDEFGFVYASLMTRDELREFRAHRNKL